MIGRTISHYKIVSQLGAGGMGVVYRAEDIRLGREVAVKFVSQDFAHDEQAVQRLRSEARAASALNHPNICTIYDVGEVDGHPFIVMELIKGSTLRDRLDSGPLKIHQIVDIGIQVADALHSTHSDGIIHRDIKPGNIFISAQGHVKVLDFGLAKLTADFEGENTRGATLERTAAGVTLGTISYMSPEQASGEQLDGRTDIFSLGVVLYECATGRHPFSGQTTAVTLAAILNKPPPAPGTLNPELPIRLQEVIANCLEKDRELRYQSAAELRADLKRARRDIESGHSLDVRTVSGSRALSAALSPSSQGSVPPAMVSAASAASAVSAAAPAASQRVPAAMAAPGSSTKWLVAAVAIAAAVLGALYLQGSFGRAPDGGITQVLSRAAVQSRLDLANAALDARNYRAAAAYAAEVLAVDATNAEAITIRDESQAMLGRFDVAIADARQRLAEGDVQGAARALETARVLDPTSPSVVDLATRLGEVARQREAGRQAPTELLPSDTRRQARATIPSPPPPPPAAAPVPAEPAPTPAARPVEAPPAPPPAAVAPPAPPAVTAENRPVPPLETRPIRAPAETRPAPSAIEARPTTPATPPPVDEDAAIRRLAATYARAIETKDLALFRSIKPNLSREEERRLQDGFRAVVSQRVSVAVTSIDRRGDEATVLLRRRDVIQVGGREQTAESQQTLRVGRSGSAWIILAIK
jgi:serine/threonine protein kinase